MVSTMKAGTDSSGTALPLVARHPMVLKLAALLERGSNLDLRIASLHKATALVAPSGIDAAPFQRDGAAPLRRSREDFQQCIVDGALQQLQSPYRRQEPAPSASTARITIQSRSNASPRGRDSAAAAPSPPLRDVDSVSSASSSTSEASSVSGNGNDDESSSANQSSSANRGKTFIPAAHAAFLLQQMRGALVVSPHLAPAASYVDSPGHGRAAEPQQAAGPRQADVSVSSAAPDPELTPSPRPSVSPASQLAPSAPSAAAAPPPPSAPAPKKALPPPPPPPAPASKKALPAPSPQPTAASMFSTTPALLPQSAAPSAPPAPPPPAPKAPPPTPPPPAASPKMNGATPVATSAPPPPAPKPPAPTLTSAVASSAEGCSSNHGAGEQDWEEASRAALAAGVWRQAVDAKGRTYYFHTKEKKTCWNLAKELQRRSAGST